MFTTAPDRDRRIAEFAQYAHAISNPAVVHLTGRRVRATVPGTCGDTTPGRALTALLAQVTCTACLHTLQQH